MNVEACSAMTDRIRRQVRVKFAELMKLFDNSRDEARRLLN